MRRLYHWAEGQCASAIFTVLCRLVVTVKVVGSAPKASWVVMYTMNNHTMQCKFDNRLASTVSKLFRS